MKAKHFNLICKAFLSLVFVFLPISNSAQQKRPVWEYDFLDSWTIKGDSIYGRGSYSIYQSIGAIEIEGKEYTAIEIKGEDIPTSKRRRRAGQNRCRDLQEIMGCHARTNLRYNLASKHDIILYLRITQIQITIF